MSIFRETMDENDCYTLHFKICRLQRKLLQYQNYSLATDHSEVANSSTNNAQCVLHHGVVQNDINILLHSVGSPLPAMLSVDVAHFFPVQCFLKYTET